MNKGEIMKDDLLKIISTYGVLPQLKYFQSEIFEMNEAIIKYENIPNGIYEHIKNEYKEHIAEEIADVEVMLLQLKEYYHIDGNDILKIMNEKIDRQLERIKNEIIKQ